jgi:hypothetical protein
MRITWIDASAEDGQDRQVEHHVRQRDLQVRRTHDQVLPEPPDVAREQTRGSRPIEPPIMTEASPMSSEKRAPYSTRVVMSRPNASVPMSR